MPVRAPEIIPQMRPVEVGVMLVVHAHREEESAAITLPELEDWLERIVPKRRDEVAFQFPDGRAEVAAIGESSSRGLCQRSDSQREVVLGRADGR